MFVDLCYVGNLNFVHKNTVTNSLFEAFEKNNAEIFYDAAINVGDNNRRGLRKKEINKIPIEIRNIIGENKNEDLLKNNKNPETSCEKNEGVMTKSASGPKGFLVSHLELTEEKGFFTKIPESFDSAMMINKNLKSNSDFDKGKELYTKIPENFMMKNKFLLPSSDIPKSTIFDMDTLSSWK